MKAEEVEEFLIDFFRLKKYVAFIYTTQEKEIMIVKAKKGRERKQIKYYNSLTKLGEKVFHYIRNVLALIGKLNKVPPIAIFYCRDFNNSVKDFYGLIFLGDVYQIYYCAEDPDQQFLISIVPSLEKLYMTKTFPLKEYDLVKLIVDIKRGLKEMIEKLSYY